MNSRAITIHVDAEAARAYESSTEEERRRLDSLLSLKLSELASRTRKSRSAESETIVRTSRGFAIAGTRLTLSHILDCLEAGWSRSLIRDRLSLSERQIADAMAYIESHREEVEAEHQRDRQLAEESRRYWEERNRERLAAIAAAPAEPGQEDMRDRLRAWKDRLDAA